MADTKVQSLDLIIRTLRGQSPLDQQLGSLSGALNHLKQIPSKITVPWLNTSERIETNSYIFRFVYAIFSRNWTADILQPQVLVLAFQNEVGSECCCVFCKSLMIGQMLQLSRHKQHGKRSSEALYTEVLEWHAIFAVFFALGIDFSLRGARDSPPLCEVVFSSLPLAAHISMLMFVPTIKNKVQDPPLYHILPEVELQIAHASCVIFETKDKHFNKMNQKEIDILRDSCMIMSLDTIRDQINQKQNAKGTQSDELRFIVEAGTKFRNHYMHAIFSRSCLPIVLVNILCCYLFW
jgi:hypothetical protein